MNTAVQVEHLINQLVAEGKCKEEIVWQTALACVEWAYVFGAWGEFCTPSNRRKRYSTAHPTIKTKCQNFNGDKTCEGCKWLPDGQYTRFFDCRGFTDWCLAQVGIDLQGEGCTSQWGKASNWSAKGTITSMPKNTLVCLFVQKGSKMEHTGFGLNNETVECSSGVQHFTTMNKKWTHWAVPAGLGGEIPVDPDYRPTLRRGDKGEYVRIAQTELFEKGYDLGKCGIDGDFGKATEAAVKKIQKDNGLKVDGIIGSATWAVLDAPTVLYTVSIPHLSATTANELVKKYPGAVMTEERG